MAMVQHAGPVIRSDRVVLHNISWETYESLLADHESASAPRFTYDRGELEIMSPRAAHEEANRAIATFIKLVAAELEIDTRSLGSTTFRRQDLERGFEPDSCFYIQREPAIRGKEVIDLRVDPPPDLVIEVDLRHSSIDKLKLFASVGVPEVQIYEGERGVFHLLEQGAYVASDQSLALPGVTAEAVTRLVGLVGSVGRVAWLRQIRDWAQNLPRS